MEAMRLDGVITNTAPTSTSSTIDSRRIICLAGMPSCLPISSGSDSPSDRMLIMAEMKSWTAPPKMVPATIQMKAAGPYITPIMAPKIGPRPAMLRNWMRKTFHVGMGMKSTPSVFE